MRKFLLALLLTSTTAFGMVQASVSDPLTAPKLAFTENKGQVVDTDTKPRPDVLFTAENNGVKMYFRTNALSYVFVQSAKEKDEVVVKSLYRTDIEFLGANPNPRIQTEKTVGSVKNFYLGHAPNGITNVRSYEKITYQNIYPSIDLVFYTAENGAALKYEFIVKPGGNPANIQLNYKGFSNLAVERTGNINAQTPFGVLNEDKPFTFQSINGSNKEIASNYKLQNGVVTFDISGYDTNQNLIIDPLTRQWAFNRGGNLLDRGQSNTIDAAGNSVIAGYTASTAFPSTPGVVQTAFAGSNDMIVVSINPSGVINWATYYGGAGRDQAFGISSGPNNTLNVVGYTTSTEAGLATSGVFQPTSSLLGDGIVLQLSSTGTRNWASYYGGNLTDQLNDVATFTNGDLAVIGRTFSTNNIALSGSLGGNRDVYVARIKADGTSRTWARYFGGSGDDQGNTIAVDAQGNVVMAGQSTSTTGIASNGADQTIFGGSTDGFISKLNGNDGSSVWASYIGGVQLDIANGITSDANNNIFVTGLTSSPNLAQLNPIQASFGGVTDAFIAAYSPTGTRLMSSFIGGNSTEQGYGVTAIGSNIYITGASNSSNFSQLVPSPTPVNFTPQQGNNGAFDIFITKINATNFTRSFSVLYGGKADDVARDIASNANGRVIVCGYSNSPDYPTRNPIVNQATPSTGNDDAIIIGWQDDVNGCTPFGVTATGTNAQCANSPTGSIDVTSPNGSNFVYSLVGAEARPEQPTTKFFNLIAGEYTVNVRNTNTNCTSTTAIVINNDNTKTATTTVSNPACGLNGSITVNVTGALPEDIFFYQVTGPGYDQALISPSNVFTDIVNSGVYSVNITDINGCIFSAPNVTITNSGSLSQPTASTVIATCANIFDGAINIISPVGNGVQYSLSGKENRPAQTSASFKNLEQGTYFITATLGNCTSPMSSAITVGNGTSLTVTTAVSATSCQVSEDGSITVTGPAGLTSNPMYSLTGVQNRPAQTSNVFANLPTGSYTVMVMNGENCSGTTTVTVPVGTTNPVEFSSTPASCNGQNNGSLRVINPLTPGTLYSISGPNTSIVNQASPNFTGLAAGAYTLTANTPNGCSFNRVANVSTPTGLVFASIKTTPSSSCITNNGSIELQSTGGTGTVQFELSGPVSRPKQSNNVFANLQPGVYTVVATDANNCQITASATVVGPTGLTIAVTPQNTVCGNGAITVTPTIQGTYTYTLTGAANRTQTAPSPFTFTQLPAGNYTVQVTDANNCAASAVTTINVGPTTLQLNVVETPIKCKGGRAQLTVTATGATNTVTISMKDNATGVIYNPPFSSIPPGNYTISATEANSTCAANQLYAVVEPTQLTASAVATQISCIANIQQGMITVTANGGTDPKMYQLSGRTEMQTSNVIMNVEPGNYTVKVFDANACETITNSVVINAINKVRISSAVPTLTKCNGSKDGMITLNAVDGIPPFSYRINNGAFTAPGTSRTFVFSLLGAGEYTVDVRDGNGCIATQMVTVAEPSVINAVVSSVTPTSCVVGDGTLTINATGGTPPYTYSINNGATYQTSNTFNFVFAGYYEIIVKDVNNCTSTIPYSFNNAGAPTILNISKQDAQCFNEQMGTGQIVIAAASPTPQPLFYSINDGITYTATNTGAAVFSGLAAGDYLIRVSTESGCVAFGGRVRILAPTPFIIQNVITTNPVCSNSNPVGGRIEVQVTGGTLPLSYSIDNGMTYQVSNLFTDLYPRASGYQVTVRDANGCMALGAQTKFIFNSSGLTLANTPAVVQPACGNNNGSITIAPTGGSGQKRYYLNGQLIQTSSGSSYTFLNLGEGIYNIRVTDANGCSIETQITLGTVNFRLETVKASCSPFGNPDGQIRVITQGGSGNYQFSIVSGREFLFNPYSSQLVTPQSASPGLGIEEYTFTGLNIGVYEIEVRDLGNSNQGCTRKMRIAIEGNGQVPTITNVTKVDRICNGASTTAAGNPVSISVFASGATDYLLVGPGNILLQQAGSTFSEDINANALPAGEYFVFASNGDGCFSAWANNPIVITEPQPIIISNVVTTQPTCGGTPTGTATITATGGGVLEYSIDAGNTFQVSPTFTGLAPGTFLTANSSIIVRERGTIGTCQVLWPLNININNEFNFSVLSTLVNPQSCAGPADGSVAVTVSNGGGGPYTYTLTPGDGSSQIVASNIATTTYTFTGLLRGSYILTVLDARGCVATTTYPIAVLQTISDASLEAIQDVALGTCSNNMLYDVEFTYTGPEPALNISFDGGNSFDGTYRVSLSSGVGRFQTGRLIAGTYALTIVPDNSNCKIIKNIVITQSTPTTPDFTLGVVQVKNPSCNGANDGEVSITVTYLQGNTHTLSFGNTPITRTRNNPGTYTFTFSNLRAGAYPVNFSINNGACTYDMLPITLTEPPLIYVQGVTVTPMSCNGNNPNAQPDGQIVISATGAPNIDYSIDDGISFQPGNTFTGLSVGDYRVRIRNRDFPTANCILQGQTYRVTSASNFNLNVINLPYRGVIQATCNNVSDGKVEFQVDNYNGAPLTFTFNDAPVTPVLQQNLNTLFAVVNQVTPGTYTIKAVDANGCYDVLTNIVMPTTRALSVSTTQITRPNCGQTNGQITFMIRGGQDGFPMDDIFNPKFGREYEIIDAITGTIIVPTTRIQPEGDYSFAVPNLGTGVYRITVRNVNTACQTELIVSLNNLTAPTLTVQSSANPSQPTCTNGQITVRSNPAAPQSPRYQFFALNSNQNNWLTNPNGGASRTFTGMAEGTYMIRQRTGTNPNFCYTYAGPVTLTCPGSRENYETVLDHTVTVYPNPTRGDIYVQFGSDLNTTATIELFDINGKRVITKEVNTIEGDNNVELTTTNLSSGLYLMRLSIGDKVTTVKVVKD